MKIPRSFTTVTKFSRTLALIMFIAFPIMGFLLGRYYQANVNTSIRTIDSTANWKTYSSSDFSFEYPSDLSPLKLDYGPVALFKNEVDLKACKNYKHDTTNSPCFNAKVLVFQPKIFTQNQYINSNVYKQPKLNPKVFVDSQNRTWETDNVLAETYNFTGVFKNLDKYYVINLQSGSSEVPYSPQTGTGSDSVFVSFADKILSTFQFTK